jgi:SnoaL-like protein
MCGGVGLVPSASGTLHVAGRSRPGARGQRRAHHLMVVVNVAERSCRRGVQRDSRTENVGMTPHPYREALAARDLDRLLSLCTDDVTLHSPLIREPAFEGRDAAAAILAIVLQLLEDEQYAHDLGDEHSHVLVADARVLDKPIKIATLLKFDSDGKINDIWLMARPLAAMATLLKAIASVESLSGLDGASVVHELSRELERVAAAADRAAARLVDGLNRATAGQ